MTSYFIDDVSASYAMYCIDYSTRKWCIIYKDKGKGRTNWFSLNNDFMTLDGYTKLDEGEAIQRLLTWR